MTEHFTDWQNYTAIAVQRDMFTHAVAIQGLFKTHTFADRRCGWDVTPGRWLKAQERTRIVFSNPYRDRQVEALYQLCRRTHHPYLVIERGPLPDTVFLDTSGFLADSSAYDEGHFRNIASQSGVFDAMRSAYLKKATALENQSPRATLDQSAMCTSDSEKPVVLLALQMPDDVVTRKFCHDGRDYATFLAFCARCVAQLSDKVVFKVKPHPRAPDLRIGGGAETSRDVTYIPDQHIDDAIAECDLLVTFNSGVGVLAMMHHKPVAVFGRTYYASAPAVYQVDNIAVFSNLLDRLRNGTLSGNNDPFLHHLTQAVLSNVDFLPRRSASSRRKVGFHMQQLRIFDGQNFHVEVPRKMTALSEAHEWFVAIGRYARNRVQRTAP